MIGLLFIVIAVGLLVMRSLIRPSKNEPVKTAGVGVIKRRIQENCRTCFFVEFQDQNGNIHVGESIPYKSTKGKYYEDDTAKIKYYFSPNGRPFVIIDDMELVSCEKESKPVGAVMLVAAIVLIVIGVILLASSLLL